MNDLVRYVVRRKETDLVFSGTKLADVSSKIHGVDGEQRWFEARIYRTRLGQFVLEQVGASSKVGETNNYSGLCVSKESDVPEAARLFFHRKVARMVLDAAGMHYPAEEIE